MISDRRLGLLFLVLGLVFAVFVIPAQCPTVRQGSSDVPSWLIPVAGMAITAIAGGSLALASPSADNVDKSRQRTGSALLCLAGIALYFALTQVIGFVVITAAAMVFYLHFIAGFGWVRSVVLAVSFCAVVYGLFELGFRIKLPAGMLF